MGPAPLAGLFQDPELVGLFSEDQLLRRMLAVEGALAVVQSRLGVIPAEAGARIAAVAPALAIDIKSLRRGFEVAGVPVIDLVRQLRAAVDDEAADYVHWGATSQDIVDTAVVLQIRAALDVLEGRLGRLIAGLARMADAHRATRQAGRTHSQQALPITFGLKVAGWLAPLIRHRARLAQLIPRLLALQFGGAAGTLAALGTAGPQVQAALAAELDLALPPVPWHTQRDGLAELAGWLSLVNAGLAKMAQDVILLAQSEVAEVRESADPARGGSSTMPQKSNPIVSELIISAARLNATLLPAMHQALIQEHERGTHGWQMEWLALPQMFSLTGVSVVRAEFLSENLVVDRARMRANLDASHGLLLAEALTYALAPEHLSRAAAKELVTAACRRAAEQGRHLVDVVREMTAAPLDWEGLKDETAYLGATAEFIDQVLAEANAWGDGAEDVADG